MTPTAESDLWLFAGINEEYNFVKKTAERSAEGGSEEHLLSRPAPAREAQHHLWISASDFNTGLQRRA